LNRCPRIGGDHDDFTGVLICRTKVGWDLEDFENTWDTFSFGSVKAEKVTTEIWALGDDGPLRFGELRREVPGITEKMLIQQLRQLEADGVITREVYQQVPPKVEYSVTEFGASLNKALGPLGDWGQANMDRIVHRKAQASS